MNTMKKNLLLLGVAFALLTGTPYILTPGNCGAGLSLAFTGAILGCGGDKGTGSSDNSPGSSAAVAGDSRTAGDVKTGNMAEPKVTFVELGSVNCVPCRMMQPVMEQVEKKYPGQVKLIFHDVWTDTGRAQGAKYRIRVIPTQVFLDKNGKEYFRHEGFFPFEEIEKILKQKGVN